MKDYRNHIGNVVKCTTDNPPDCFMNSLDSSGKCIHRGDHFDCFFRENWEQQLCFGKSRVVVESLEGPGMKIELKEVVLWRDGDKIRLEGRVSEIAWIKLQKVMLG